MMNTAGVWRGVRGVAWLALAAAVCGLLWRWWSGPLVPAEVAQRRDVVQSVVATGRVVAPHRLDISAMVTAIVDQVPVSEGQGVKAGEVLIRLQSSELQALAAQAQAAANQAQVHMLQVSSVQAPVAAWTLAQAELQWQTAQAQQRRQTELLAQGFVGPAAWDEVNKTAQLTKAQYQAAREQWQALQPNGVDMRAAQVALEQAQAAAQAAKVRLDYAVIRAPVSGVLMARAVEPGNQVQPGKLLMTLSPAGRTQLVVAIDEKNLHLLKLGQTAWASADAYPQQRVAARLVYINPAVNPQMGAVEVKLDVDQPPPNWMQDMTVSVDIQVQRRDGVVVTALHNVHDKDTAPWVLQWVQGRAVKHEVQLGLQSAGDAQVLRGVSEGDRLIPGTAPVTAGQRVRVATP